MPHSAAPWRFHATRYGVNNAVVDADGRILFAHVPEQDGPLVAAAPTMYAVLKRIAGRLPADDELGSLARKAIQRAEAGV